MQFHLNGFRPGDPSIAPAAKRSSLHGDDAVSAEALPARVDVLIVGCGPAGLTLAAQLAAFPDIHTCIVEQTDGPLQRGRADGVACRSMEMFNAFGFADKLLKEAYWVNETTFWKPDEQQPDHIVRHGRIQDVEDGLSEFPHVILNQARVHDFYLEVMRNSPTRMQPFYSRQLITLETDAENANDPSSYPVTASFTKTDSDNTSPEASQQTETIQARYVVGCDGARSTVRQSIGLTLKGDSANQAWGVMDVLMVTDFPDVRMKSLIQSASQGSIIIIPREGGYLVRLYIELAQLGSDERVADRSITSDQLIARAKAIFHPYQIDVKEVAWWSVYEIGQRLCDRFDDVPEERRGLQTPRVFIAGDACHTHSPKAGQGMNVSMRDAFNLGWKLVSVLRNQCKPALLNTYTQERQRVAKTLIDFDREWSKIIGSRPKVSDNSSTDGLNPSEFQRYFIRHGRYTAGTAIQYQPSTITADSFSASTVDKSAYLQSLATGFEPGMRFHSAPVIRLADAKPMQLGHVVKADCCWRLFIFADDTDPVDRAGAAYVLCEYLESNPQSPLQRFSPAGNGQANTENNSDANSFLDVRSVYQQSFRDIDLQALPSLLFPKKGVFGLIDYEKVFCADSKSGDDIFDMRGIDRKRGCMVLVRPDQHVAMVLPLSEPVALTEFFEQFMVSARVG